MKNIFVLKVLVLTAMLVGVLMTIQRLNSGTVEKAFDAIGIQAGSAQSPGFQPSERPLAAGEESFNICPNRIDSIRWDSGPLAGSRVEEAREGLKMRWMAYNPQPRELGYLAVEKWLSAHCKIAVKSVTAETGIPALAKSISVPFMTIRYIDSKELKIEVGANSTYVFKGVTTKSYQSQDLASALHDLEEIAQLTPASP